MLVGRLLAWVTQCQGISHSLVRVCWSWAQQRALLMPIF